MYTPGYDFKGNECSQECGGSANVTQSWWITDHLLEHQPYHCWCGTCGRTTRLYKKREEAIQAWINGESITISEQIEDGRKWLREHEKVEQMELF